MHLSLFKPFQPKMGSKWASTNKDLFPGFWRMCFLRKIYLYHCVICNIFVFDLLMQSVASTPSRILSIDAISFNDDEWTHLPICSILWKNFQMFSNSGQKMKMSWNDFELQFQLFATLRIWIREHARLFFFQKYSTLFSLIKSCSLIKILKYFSNFLSI